MQLSNIGDQESTPVAISGRKSTKIPVPPKLNDDKEPHFEDWLLLISQKLAAKADHFDRLQLWMAYMASRCEDKAQMHITPRTPEEVSEVLIYHIQSRRVLQSQIDSITRKYGEEECCRHPQDSPSRVESNSSRTTIGLLPFQCRSWMVSNSCCRPFTF